MSKYIEWHELTGKEIETDDLSGKYCIASKYCYHPRDTIKRFYANVNPLQDELSYTISFGRKNDNSEEVRTFKTFLEALNFFNSL